MNSKNLISGVLALVLAISTVFAFSEKLTSENGAYWDDDLMQCIPIHAEGCTEDNTSIFCELDVNGNNKQIYKPEDLVTQPCDVPLFRLTK